MNLKQISPIPILTSLAIVSNSSRVKSSTSPSSYLTRIDLDTLGLVITTSLSNHTYNGNNLHSLYPTLKRLVSSETSLSLASFASYSLIFYSSISTLARRRSDEPIACVIISSHSIIILLNPFIDDKLFNVSWSHSGVSGSIRKERYSKPYLIRDMGISDVFKYDIPGHPCVALSTSIPRRHQSMTTG